MDNKDKNDGNNSDGEGKGEYFNPRYVLNGFIIGSSEFISHTLSVLSPLALTSILFPKYTTVVI